LSNRWLSIPERSVAKSKRVSKPTGLWLFYICDFDTAEKRRLLNHQKMQQFHRYDMAAEIIEAVK
jgi:hypothetical protein